MQNLVKDVKYLLMVIDVFSKHRWIKPLKNKKRQTVADAFNVIFTSSERIVRRFGDILAPLSRETKLNMRFQE